VRFDQTKTNARNESQRRGDIRDRRNIHFAYEYKNGCQY
jgi:hypothetical protein